MAAYGTDLANTHTPAAASLDERMRYAQELSQAGLLPRDYRGKPANVLVAIETGHMLGIAPMAALHNIHIVEGKPTLSAALMSALVRRAGHTMRVWAEGDSKAVAELIRRDDPGFTYRAEWTMERARTAGLLGKDVWKKYQVNMLKNRVASEVCRDGAQEVFLGPVYVPEELAAAVDHDGDPVAVEHPDPAQQQKTTPTTSPGVNWESELQAVRGDYAGLRDLWQKAMRNACPQEYLNRVQAAGEEAAPATTDPVHDEPVDAEVIEETEEAEEPTPGFVDDAPLCPGTGVTPDEHGGFTITDQSGIEWAYCEHCGFHIRAHNGRVLPHGDPGEIDWDKSIRLADGDDEALRELAAYAAQQLGADHSVTRRIRDAVGCAEFVTA